MAHDYNGGNCPDSPPPWSDPWETWHRAVHLSGYHVETADYAMSQRQSSPPPFASKEP